MDRRVVKELDKICERIRKDFDAKDAAREKALALTREVIRNSANAIRAVHRGEFEDAKALMDKSAGLLAEVEEALRDHPDVYYAGFVHDSQKEHAEAHQTYAMIRGEPLPSPEEIGVQYAAYLNGLGDTVGELRRHALDKVRENDIAWSQGILEVMDDIYYTMVSLDYPAAISKGLKRTADVVRSLIERTRGDLTNAVRQQQLEASLARLEEKLNEGK